MDQRPDLPDVNVWLALSVAEHPHHPRAATYWRREAAPTVAFCRHTMLGLLRLLTNATVMGEQPLSVGDAWAAYSTWRALTEVVLATEPVGCEARLNALARDGAIAPRTWTDGYLAAFARSGRMRVVTFDRDLQRLGGADVLLLTT